MNTLILVIVSLLLLNKLFILRRTVAVNKLHALYDSLENEIIKQRLTPDKKLVTFLGIIKTPIKLNHTLDIFWLISYLNKIEKNDKGYSERKNSFIEYTNSLPDEVKSILNEIQKKQDSVITLSIFKPFNLVFLLVVLVASLIGAAIYFTLKTFGIMLDSLIKLPRQLKEAYENESAIISYQQTRIFNA